MSLKNKIYVKPEKSRLINLLDDIKSGRIRIPVFQRDYVWKKNQRLELFDSLNSGFPIGSLLFWKPQDLTFKFNEKIGPFFIDYQTSNYSYVLDGFQRISTLFGSLINYDNYNHIVDIELLHDYIIHYDLKEEEFIQLRGKEEFYQIPLYKLIDTFEFLSFSEKIRENADYDESSTYINRAKKLANQLLDYEIPYVEIIGGDIEDAVEIFHRINSKGSDISPIWMLNALTYKENEFRFHNEIIDLKQRLETYNFQEIPTDVILHCIETSTGKIYFDVNLKKLAKDINFQQLVKDTFVNIEFAVKFLYENLNVFDSKILPYNLQLIFITEFFRLNSNPSTHNLNELERWFWITSYSNYFSIYSLSKQRKAFQQFQEFAIGERSNSVYYDDNRRFKTLEFPDKILYGSVRSKCLALFLINHYLKSINNTYLQADKEFEFRYLINRGKRAEMAIPVNKTSPLFLLSKKDLPSNYTALGNLTLEYPELAKALFIDEHLTNLLSERVDFYGNLYDHRKSLIMNEEANFVENLGIEYFGFDVEADFEKYIPADSIKKNIERLQWDYINEYVYFSSEEGPQFDSQFHEVEELINFINDNVIQDVFGEMPSYILKNNDYLDYEYQIREYLIDHKFAEIKKMGWDIDNL